MAGSQKCNVLPQVSLRSSSSNSKSGNFNFSQSVGATLMHFLPVPSMYLVMHYVSVQSSPSARSLMT